MMNTKRSSKFKLTRYAFLVPAVVALLLVFSISKAALVKKDGSIVKAFSALTAKSADKATAKPAANRSVVINPGTVKNTFQPIKLNTTDTIKKGSFIAGLSGSDSAIYIINGVKVTKADVEKLNEKNISGMYVVTSPEKIKKLMPGLDGKHSVIAFNTNDEAGQAFGEKLHDAISAKTYVARGDGRMAIIADGNKIYTDSAIYLVNGKNGSSGRTYTVQSFSYNSPAITIADKPMRISGKLNNFHIKKDSLTNSSYSFTYLTTDSVDAHGKAAVTTRLYSAPKSTNFHTLTLASSSKFSLDHIADKLIIINGKMSNHDDLKKISAFDIDKVVFKNDEETKELYGDTAKNGIVFIVTKKGKK